MKKSRHLLGGFLLLLLLLLSLSIAPLGIAHAQTTTTTTITTSATTTKKEGAASGRDIGRVCRCVAFRLDDVDDINHPDIEHLLLNIFQNSNTGLTVGIIGNRFGNNTGIVSHLAAMLKNNANSPSTNNGKLEIANHGWNHEDFSALSLEKQVSLMQKTSEKIQRILKVTPTVFIAPFNKINNSTYLAAKKNGMYAISADPITDPPPPGAIVSPDSSGMYHLPYSALTAYVDKDEKHWDAVPLTTIEKGVLDGLKKHGYAVIEMHPQEFFPRNPNDGSGEVIDENHLADMESLIRWLHSEKIEIVTLGWFASSAAAVATAPEFQSTTASNSPTTSTMLIAALAITSTIAVVKVLSRKRQLKFTG
jgi:peptidoglycan/xylan/chitin deacetylase (PgdA/CDA1 family)